MKSGRQAAGKAECALVSGAAGGIGSAVARRFARRGLRVGAMVLPGQEAPGGLALAAEATDEAQVNEVVARCAGELGPPRWVVHTVGAVGEGPLADVSPDRWRRLVEVNLTSAFLLARAAHPHLKQTRGAMVLYSSSNAISGGNKLSGPAYTAAKAGIIGMVRYLAKEWAADGIRVNCIAPGPIDTPMLDRLGPEQRARLARRAPLGRLGTARECAGLTDFLCSEAAAHMTGTVANLSGGLVLD